MNHKLIWVVDSKGIKLTKELIAKYKLDTGISIQEKEEGILIKSLVKNMKLSWEDTYKEMSNENEDWDDFEVTIGDGLLKDNSKDLSTKSRD